MPIATEMYSSVAEAAWRWVLDQVRWDDGPWIPTSVTVPAAVNASWDRDGLHSGVGGLAYVLAEVRRCRPWTAEEQNLADAVAERLCGAIPAQTDCTYFDGLVSTVGVLTALEAPGAETAVARLAALAGSDGWPQTALQSASYIPGAPHPGPHPRHCWRAARGALGAAVRRLRGHCPGGARRRRTHGRG
jgi:hypothetical protein